MIYKLNLASLWIAGGLWYHLSMPEEKKSFGSVV